MKKKWWGFLSLLFFVTSCSHVSQKAPLNYSEHVELGPNQSSTVNESDKVIPKISEETKDEQEGEGITYQVRAPILALHLGPGLYRAFGHVGILRQFERKKISVQMISGSGFGLIIAALYAKYQSSARVEWGLFKLLAELKENSRPYSKEWREVIREFLEKEFGKVEIQKLKIPLYVPVYNSGRRQLEVYRRGPLIPKLISILNLEPSPKYGNFSSSLIKAGTPWQSLYQLGADIVVVVELLSCGIDFKENDSYLLGLSQGIVGRMEREKNHVHLWGGPKHCRRFLDDLRDQETFFHKVEKWGDGFAEEVKTILETWKNNSQKVIKGQKYETKDL